MDLVVCSEMFHCVALTSVENCVDQAGLELTEVHLPFSGGSGKLSYIVISLPSHEFSAPVIQTQNAVP